MKSQVESPGKRYVDIEGAFLGPEDHHERAVRGKGVPQGRRAEGNTLSNDLRDDVKAPHSVGKRSSLGSEQSFIEGCIQRNLLRMCAQVAV